MREGRFGGAHNWLEMAQMKKLDRMVIAMPF